VPLQLRCKWATKLCASCPRGIGGRRKIDLAIENIKALRRRTGKISLNELLATGTKVREALESFSRTNVKERAALLDANLAECNDPRRRRGPHSDCARDGRNCAPWPPGFVGGHGATTTLPVGRARVADQEGLLCSIVDATCCRQAASGGAGADVETRRARMPPSLPRRLQTTLSPDLPGVGPCSAFRRGPFRTVPESELDADLCRELFDPDICRDA
jgi:hypothetical protein